MNFSLLSNILLLIPEGQYQLKYMVLAPLPIEATKMAIDFSLLLSQYGLT